MKRVVLVNPRLGFHEDITRSYSIPLGLLQSAVFLEKKYNVIIIDQKVDNNWKKKLMREIKKEPLCIGISSKTGNQLKYCLDICNFVKKKSKIPIILGGVHASIFPEQTLEDDRIDYIIAGEGEYTFPELVKAIEKKKGFSKVKGIGYKKDGKPIITPRRPLLDMETLPEVPYHLVDIKKYSPKKFFVQTSRGCTYECTFCYNNYFNHKRKWRHQSSKRVIKTLKNLISLNVKDILFIDDHFFADMKRVENIMDWIIKNNIKIKWHAEGTRIDSLAYCSESFLRKMVRSGCSTLRFGLESGSPKILKNIKKELKIKDVIYMNRRFRNTGIRLEYNTMCGFPDESLKDLKMTVDLVLKLTSENKHATIQGPSILGAYPKTEIFEQIRKPYGIKSKRTLQEWSDFEWTNTNNIPWIPKNRREILSKLFLLLIFVDNKIRDKENTPLILKIVDPIYRPIAKFRCKHMFFKFMPEYPIHKKILEMKNYKRE